MSLVTTNLKLNKRPPNESYSQHNDRDDSNLDLIDLIVTRTIASGTATLGTSPISSGAKASTVTVSAPGTLATDTLMADFNADPTGVTGYAPSTNGMLAILKFPTADNVNFIVINNTPSSITPGAITLNWRVVR